jgi:hypothetical protein
VTEQDFPKVICGRRFTRADLDLIRRIIAADPASWRTKISREACAALGWFKPDGGLKDMSCRVALLRLHRAGLIQLPAPRNGASTSRTPRRTPEGEPRKLIVQPVQQLLPLTLQRVTRKESPLWNELVDRYHYLGYKHLTGAQLRYLVHSPAGLLAALGFSAAAWKVQPRDAWIGWSAEQRVANLHLVVNNSRFLILPWVQSKNLASKILAACARRLPADWLAVYGYRPVLLETFVEKDRFHGTCYKAANWVHVGTTQGRGKLDRYKERKLPVKDIYLYPLAPDFRQSLAGSIPPSL